MQNFIKYHASQCVHKSDEEALVAEFAAEQAADARDFRHYIAAQEEEESRSGQVPDTDAEEIFAAFVAAQRAAAAAQAAAKRDAGRK